MRIEGNGSYGDSLGNVNKVLGVAEIADDSIENFNITGNILFKEINLKKCNLVGNANGDSLRGVSVVLCGGVDITDICCEDLHVTGKLSSKKIKTKKAELFFNDGADIGEIDVNSNLKITRKTDVENVKINIKLPFFNLNFDASHVDNFEKSQIMISKIRALGVDLSGCHIGELICESGKLQECHVDSLVCKNDIAIGEDCVIKKIVKI